MKSLIRWSITLGLVGGTVLTSWFGLVTKALALPQEQIIKILQPVPVFTLVNAQGAPIVAVVDNKQVTGIFISQQDAQEFFQKLQQQNPELAKQVKVQPISLGEAFKFAQSQEGNPQGLNVQYVPTPEEVEVAKQVMSQNGGQYQGGVPLFTAKVGEDQLVIERDNVQKIPFFFEKAQLQQLIEQLKKEQPELAKNVKIEVVPLEGVIAAMEQRDDEGLTKIWLVPTQESQEFLRSASQNQGQQSQQNQQNQQNQSAPQNQQQR